LLLPTGQAHCWRRRDLSRLGLLRGGEAVAPQRWVFKGGEANSHGVTFAPEKSRNGWRNLVEVLCLKFFGLLELFFLNI